MAATARQALGEPKSASAAGAGLAPVAPSSLWIEQLTLTDFRNYARAEVDVGAGPIVLFGANGVGKTNLLEAVSLIAAGQGLRRAPFESLIRQGAPGGWAVAARVRTPGGVVAVGTGLSARATAPSEHEREDDGDDEGRSGRIVRIDGATRRGSGALADIVEMAWLTPAMDGLFTGPAGDRRHFLDRLVLCFDPAFRSRLRHFERAMRQRNRLLEEGVRDPRQFAGLERQMAETGVAVAAGRATAVAALAAMIGARREQNPVSPFPWAGIGLEGSLDAALGSMPAVDVEDLYARRLAEMRERDRAAGRALEGPHRTDLVVSHGPKAMPAALSSTGEQKALLIGLVLAHAELQAQRGPGGAAPILLLDEVAAHLDAARRAALFDELIRLGSQAWMTGTDRALFAALEGRARFLAVADGQVGAG